MQGENHKPDPREDPWTRAILAHPDIARTEAPGSWIQYHPERVVVDAGGVHEESRHAKEIEAVLARAYAKPVDPRDDDEALAVRTAERLGLKLYAAPRERSADLPDLVRRLQAITPGAAALDHVLVGDPHRFGGTSPAIPAARPDDIPGKHVEVGKGLTLAILDTGLDAALGLAPVPPEYEEVPDEDHDDDLDPPAGHGTFIAGIIRRYAPGATIVPVRLLTSPAGIATELQVAAAMAALPPVDVINCSFGGPALDDAAPLVIERALAALPPSTVVVAAAGNEGLDRPHWPGASKRVVAVGSVERCEDEAWMPAEYSNFGWWVDAAAPGSRVHSVFLKYEETGPGGPPNRTFDHGALWSGTSFATPKVAASVLAMASRDGIPVREAVYRLVEDPARQRISGLGTLVLP